MHFIPSAPDPDAPEASRTAYQRLYDMILSHGTEEVYENEEKVTQFQFFTPIEPREKAAGCHRRGVWLLAGTPRGPRRLR
jgi:hypothetical protein